MSFRFKFISLGSRKMYSDKIKVDWMRRMQLSGRKPKVETTLTFHVYEEPHITKTQI